MKKWILLAASSAFMMNAYADKNKMYCDYKDYFHLNAQSRPVYVVSGFSEQDVILELVGPLSFIIRDSYFCRSGYAHVTVAADKDHWCVLDIKDGPYMNHPSVSPSCNGLRYINTTYDGLGSYSYSINLD
jgi:hypothetical protein